MNADILDRDDYPLPDPDLPEGTPRSTFHTSSDTARFEATLLRLHPVLEVAGFWAAIQSIVSELVPNDACVLYLNAHDFSKTSHIPRILATARATKCLKWMRPRDEGQMMPTLISANPSTKVCQLSDISFDPRQLCHSEFFRRYMAPANWHHIACLLFWDQTKLSAEIAIMRTAKQGAFTDQEVAALNRLHPHIEATVRRLIALEKRDRARIVLSFRRTPESSQSNAAHSALNEMGLSARPIGAEASNGRPSEGEALTPAEVEVVQLLHAGLSNKEIAQRLDKSIRTVKTQLTSIYRKYAVRSRTRLLAATRAGVGSCPSCDTP